MSCLKRWKEGRGWLKGSNWAVTEVLDCQGKSCGDCTNRCWHLPHWEYECGSLECILLTPRRLWWMKCLTIYSFSWVCSPIDGLLIVQTFLVSVSAHTIDPIPRRLISQFKSYFNVKLTMLSAYCFSWLQYFLRKSKCWACPLLIVFYCPCLGLDFMCKSISIFRGTT